MTSLIRSLTSRTPSTALEQRDMGLSFTDWLNMFEFGGLQYGVVSGGTPGQAGEKIDSSFEGYVRGAYKSNGIVFACMAARAKLFSEARFQFRRLNLGRPGDLFGTQALAPLENPWPGGTTGDLLARAIQDVDLAGNFYATRRGNTIRRLRPDWVTIVTGSRTGSEIDTEIIGYAYQPGGPASGEDPIVILPEFMAHFAPNPDPIARYRGMSWLSPIIDEILSDESATTHKRTFFENGAKLGYVVTMGDGITPEQFDKWIEKFKLGHEQGILTAYKTLFLAGGADVKTVGADMKQIDFKTIQGAGETRIAAAAGVSPVIVGLSEGLQGSSLNVGNFSAARRLFADGTMRPLWRNIAGSLARIIDVPAGAELWYDARDISFLQEDQKDAADIQQVQAATIAGLVKEGFTPESAIAAVVAQDMTLLDHTGLVSVQLQPPGSPSPADLSQNGNGQPQLPSSTQ